MSSFGRGATNVTKTTPFSLHHTKQLRLFNKSVVKLSCWDWGILGWTNHGEDVARWVSQRRCWTKSDPNFVAMKQSHVLQSNEMATFHVTNT